MTVPLLASSLLLCVYLVRDQEEINNRLGGTKVIYFKKGRFKFCNISKREMMFNTRNPARKVAKKHFLEDPIFLPATSLSYLAQNPDHLSLANGNNSIAAASSVVHQSSAPNEMQLQSTSNGMNGSGNGSQNIMIGIECDGVQILRSIDPTWWWVLRYFLIRLIGTVFIRVYEIARVLLSNENLVVSIPQIIIVCDKPTMFSAHILSIAQYIVDIDEGLVVVISPYLPRFNSGLMFSRNKKILEHLPTRF